MDGKFDDEAALVEAILFLEGEPVDVATIARIASLSKDAVDAALEKLRERQAQDGSGLEIIEIGGGLAFAVKRRFWDFLRDRYGKRNENRLSRAAIETLSIIAYSQPITRAEVEAIRGVAADNMIRLLLDRQFIKEVGKKEAPGKPVQYGTTKEFLETFRLGSIADLPKLDDAERERFELDGE